MSRKESAARIASLHGVQTSSFASALSRYGSTILLLVLLLGEAGVGAFVIRDLTRSNSTVQDMYNGSVQGLLKFGDLQYHAQETRRSTLYALTTSDGNLQVEYAEQSRKADNAVTQGIKDYLATARTPQETRAGQRLAEDWKAYLQVRDDVLGRILESSIKEAVQIDLLHGVPQFERVRQDLDEIKTIYDQKAFHQLATVHQLSINSMIRLLAAFGFAVLLGGFAIWGVQKIRTRSAVQVAKLQMDFVASVSHELRTPVTAIMSAAENLRDGLVTGREQIIEQSTVITDQATQLANLVEQVLLFSATAKASQLHIVGEVRVDEIIEDAIDATATLLYESGFVVERQIQPDLPPLLGDPSLLSQCLQNLISNAVKYSPVNKWVRISARVADSANEIQIKVQDHGIGIKSSDLSNIFEPFYRSPDVVSTHIKGTGLGLSIARRSAEAVGGSLAVSSEPGVGSVFTLLLPAGGARSAAMQFPEASKAGYRI